jgi:hypothetical protein
MFKTYNFTCINCFTAYEDLCEKEQGGPDFDGTVPCPECGTENKPDVIVTPNLASFSMLDREGRSASLKARSAAHSAKMAKKNMDEIRAKWSGKVRGGKIGG